MSDLQLVRNEILATQQSFEDLAKIHGVLNFKGEAQFAVQAMEKNSFLLRVAKGNPKSLQNAVVNIAAIGLSLNPALKQGYLVPRGSEICFDPSYIGLIYLATEAKSIKWAQAETVRKKDKFVFNGVGVRPTHEMQAFEDRGEVVGVYVVAKTLDGEYLTSMMSVNEINAIRDKTQAYQSYKNGKAKQCPWVDFYEEMAKKTVIKRATKTWPKTDQTERLDKAIAIDNEVNKVDFSGEGDAIQTVAKNEEHEEIKNLIEKLNKTEAAFLPYAKGKLNDSTIEKVEDMNGAQCERILAELRGMVSQLEGVTA